MSVATQFDKVTVMTKANVYFDGKVISHSVLFPDGCKKTLGLIYPGRYHFGTDKAERMEIVTGQCLVKIDGQPEPVDYTTGQAFTVPAKCGFDIEVRQSLCEYICSFLS